MGILADSLHFFTLMGILADSLHFFTLMGILADSLHFFTLMAILADSFTFSHQWQYWPIPPLPTNLPVHNPGPPLSPAVVYSDRVTVHSLPSGNPDPRDIPPCSKHLSCKVLFQHPSLVYGLPSQKNYSQIPMP